jgi:hypothetical protein
MTHYRQKPSVIVYNIIKTVFNTATQDLEWDVSCGVREA